MRGDKNIRGHFKKYWMRYAILLVAICIFGGAVNWYFSNINSSSSPTNPTVTKYENELPKLEKRAKSEPKNASAQMDLAVAQYAVGDLEQARDNYKNVVQLEDSNATAFNNLGNVYRDLKEYDNSIESYKKAIDLNPTLLNPYFNLASVQQYSLSKTNDAIETYKQALRAVPDNEQIMVSLAQAYEANNTTAEAIKTYKAILAKNPDNKTARSNLNRLENQ